MKAARPPAFARWLVSAFVREPEREYALGDLEEQFSRAPATWKSRRRYWIEAFRIIWHARWLRARRAAPRPPRRVDLSSVWFDIRLGLRSAVRSPGYSLITILTLALAIGANTLCFSLANPLLVRSLPVAEPATLGWIRQTNPERGLNRAPSSLADFLDWRERLKSFSALAAYEFKTSTLTGRGDARRVFTIRSTANLTDVWGLVPETGRLFRPGEDAAGAPLVALLSDRFWREEFQQDARAVGSTYTLDGTPFTIVGVIPASMEIGSIATVDFWVPLTIDPTQPRDRRTVRTVGRLAAGATVASANAELQPVMQSLARDHAETNAGWTARVVPTRDALASDDTWVVLGTLGFIVLFVLLIACANLANLVLARLVARRREAAVRLALGSSRWQLVRPVLVENLALSVAGGVAALGLAAAGLRVMKAFASEPFFRLITIDANVLAFTAILAIGTPVLFSLWPALTVGRDVAQDALHGVRTGGGRGLRRRRHLLVAAEVALASSLLVVSALCVQSMLRYQRIDLGMASAEMLTYRVDLPADRYGDDEARRAFVGSVAARLAAIPGVKAAAAVDRLPVIESDSVKRLSGVPYVGRDAADQPWAARVIATPGYFSSSGVQLLAGRPFEDTDLPGRLPVAVINRVAADRYFDGVASAVGKTMTVHEDATASRTVTIVGVVSDTRDAERVRSSPQVYEPFAQRPAAGVRFIVRASDPSAHAAGVRAVLRAADPLLAASPPRVLATEISEDDSSNVINGLLSAFGVLALSLAAAGLYGVISYAVAQRRREIGVRLALGASPRVVARMIVRDGLRLGATGTVIGLFLAALMAQALARASSTLLYGITPTDPATFVSVTLVVVVVTALASWSPARRAMRVDPASTLRTDA